MSLRERIYARTDKPMSWTKAILLGTLIWVVAILLLGQLPSMIIYWNDQNIASIIEFTQKIPGVGEAGLNTTQINMIRDIVANAVQMGILTVMLVAAYFWQERKRKRTGAKGLQDTVKGYMSGK
jgi:asparagine N-glycosylation enzyme membrane subunit Stt3